MSTGWIYLIASAAGALFGWAVNRRDLVAFGLGIATGVACGFVAIYESVWPALPAALLALGTWKRRRQLGRS